MKITLNFADEQFPEDSLSVAEIMQRKKYSFPHVITMLNEALVQKTDRKTTLVHDGDELQVYHLISGG
ncbi:MAG: MoaD/ThiS family protein [Spirochaetaceae bacterium]|nr:MoaD/ThiS family protein [Spirochaetaceae bacterium]